MQTSPHVAEVPFANPICINPTLQHLCKRINGLEGLMYSA